MSGVVSPERDKFVALAHRSHRRRAVLDGDSVELLKRHLLTCPDADPTRSAAWAKLWARLLAPAERAAASREEEDAA